MSARASSPSVVWPSSGKNATVGSCPTMSATDMRTPFTKQPLRRRGLCSEAVAGLLSWAFRPQRDGGWGFRRVHIRCAGNNLASQILSLIFGNNLVGSLPKPTGTP